MWSSGSALPLAIGVFLCLVILVGGVFLVIDRVVPVVAQWRRDWKNASHLGIRHRSRRSR